MYKIIISIVTLLLVTGCNSTPPNYYYGEYTSTVYSYFKADEITIDEQVEQLEEIIQTAAQNNMLVAPGVHAHLGMLYFELGNQSLGIQNLEIEKQLFPESSTYIDFLLKSARGA